MSSFVLKIIAIISMLFDHVSYTIFNKFSFMNYIGRFAFPIFAFQITEGYSHTKDLKKYFFRLFLFAIISQVPYMLFISTNGFSFNILFTLILGLLSITVYEKLDNKYLGLLLVILCCIIAQCFYFDYGWFGIAIIFIFHIFKNKKLLMNLAFITVAFVNYFYKYITAVRYEYLFIILFCVLALIPINLYNGKRKRYKVSTLYLLSFKFNYIISCTFVYLKDWLEFF